MGTSPRYSNWSQQFVIKTIQFFKQSKLGYALSKQVVTEELLKSGFSPWVHSNIAIYNAIDNFNINT